MASNGHQDDRSIILSLLKQKKEGGKGEGGDRKERKRDWPQLKWLSFLNESQLDFIQDKQGQKEEENEKCKQSWKKSVEWLLPKIN